MLLEEHTDTGNRRLWIGQREREREMPMDRLRRGKNMPANRVHLVGIPGSDERESGSDMARADQLVFLLCHPRRRARFRLLSKMAVMSFRFSEIEGKEEVPRKADLCRVTQRAAFSSIQSV